MQGSKPPFVLCWHHLQLSGCLQGPYCYLSACAMARTHLLCSTCLLLLPYLSSHLLHLLLPSSLDLLALQLACSHPLARLDRLLFQNAVVHHKLQQRRGMGTPAGTVAHPAHTPWCTGPRTHRSGHPLPEHAAGLCLSSKEHSFPGMQLGHAAGGTSSPALCL